MRSRFVLLRRVAAPSTFGCADKDVRPQKEEAAISRLYAGIHYRTDIDVGKTHGKRIGDYTVRFATRDGADGSLR